MNFGVWLLKHVFPKRERERCEMRAAVTYATAHAEDTARDLQKIDLEALRKRFENGKDNVENVRQLWFGGKHG